MEEEYNYKRKPGRPPIYGPKRARGRPKKEPKEKRPVGRPPIYGPKKASRPMAENQSAGLELGRLIKLLEVVEYKKAINEIKQLKDEIINLLNIYNVSSEFERKTPEE